MTLDRIELGLPTLPLALSWAGQVAAVSLGIVAAVIAVALFIVSRSRWGQNKPLTMCIALAVLAHVWLLMYAYGTRVRQAGPGNGGTYSMMSLPTSIEFVELPNEQTAENFEAPSTLKADETDRTKEESAPNAIEDFSAENKTFIEEVPSLLPPSEEPKPITGMPTATAESLAETTPAPVGVETPVQALESPTVVEQGKEPESEVAVAENTNPTPVSSQTPALSLTSASGIDGNALQLQAKRRAHDQQIVPEAYQLRLSDSRASIAAMFGGDASTEAADDAALGWLAANQEADGSWNAAKHGAGRETRTMNYDRQGTGSKADTGIGGLALLAFLGAGNTHDAGRYANTVSAGLSYLINSQMPSGDLAGPKQIGAGDDVRFARMYCHGMALLALSEAYAMTGDQRLIDPIHRGAAYTLKAQNPQSGGWRYQVQLTGDPGDLSQFGWQAMALHSARHAGVAMTPEIQSRLYRFLDSVASGRHGGLAVYRPVPGQLPTTAMTAEALATRRLIQYPLKPAADDEATTYLLQALPGRGEENVYYWYYATLALFQKQDEAWRVWNDALKTHLVASQNQSSTTQGSWDPRCIWSGYGGRVYSTAMSCLCLEVYYRYLPLYQHFPTSSPNKTLQWQTARPPSSQMR